MKKICRTCKIEKEITEFPKHKAYKDGYETQCKQCRKEKRIKKLEENKENCPTNKVCNTCGRLLPIAMYSVNKALKYGHSNRCKDCDKEIWSVYKEENKDRINKQYVERYHSDPEFRKHRLETGKKVREKRKKEHPEKLILQSSKQRAKEKGLEHNIELSDIIIPEYCPILNIKLEFGGKGIQTFNSPSIDRIDSTKGYIKGNIQIISLRANMMKNDATKEEIELFCKNIMKYMNNEEIVRTVENEESAELEDKEPLR